MKNYLFFGVQRKDSKINFFFLSSCLSPTKRILPVFFACENLNLETDFDSVFAKTFNGFDGNILIASDLRFHKSASIFSTVCLLIANCVLFYFIYIYIRTSGFQPACNLSQDHIFGTMFPSKAI